MRRMICCAVLALLLSSGAVFAQRHVASRPRVRFIAVHRYHYHPSYFLPYYVQVPFQYPGPYSTGYSVQNYVAPSIEYVFSGSSSPARAPLVFKDGTTYYVSDYWRVDDQLHFVTMEEGGTKSVPHNVPFDNLDEQRTKDAAAAQGFRFLIRDEPLQQWLEDRARRAPSPAHSKTGKS